MSTSRSPLPPAEEVREPPSDLVETEAELARTKAALERLGPVNLLAVQEQEERFQATFQEVNAHFGQTFARLFRGGEAEMRLLDEEDMLESGIEILARPLITLLFALFKTKPSSFCILDEVDAPLDDVNTTRFVDVLREMSENTRFIVITHNKLTMEVAGTLYGVTMEEKGVSKLVSVQMEEVQSEEERATA